MHLIRILANGYLHFTFSPFVYSTTYMYNDKSLIIRLFHCTNTPIGVNHNVISIIFHYKKTLQTSTIESAAVWPEV